MEKLTGIAKVTVTVVVVVVVMFLTWFYVKTTIVNVAYNAGNQACMTNTGNAIINQLKEAGQLTVQTDDGNVVLVPKVEEAE